ncbi:hypothetical protein DSO57_1031958 [Entomophthora muscae]|uniref:Uncharacterized protein n=1 Tax=Entomophthora muscae TaxID=34485 RepID=A0ACC2TZB0_9FUNG|nr:hypothetical protein DSO57_1031958 [Entomophthora muscae]
MPGFLKVTLVKPPFIIELEFFHPHHLNLPLGHSRVPIMSTMKEIPFTPLPNVPPAQDFSKLGVLYIKVLGLTNHVVPYTGSWCYLATAMNYFVRIAPIVYMAFQTRPASPVGVQLDSDMRHDTLFLTPIHFSGTHPAENTFPT